MAPGNPDDDRDGITETDDLEELYSGHYLRDCADDEARAERLAELRRRIEQRAYTVSAERIAEELLQRGLKS
jgi:anti-sigma28 factor (negative regulator of flagellin synthesis)